jgi:hypothetical protein
MAASGDPQKMAKRHYRGFSGRQLRALRAWFGMGMRDFADLIPPFTKDHLSMFENNLLGRRVAEELIDEVVDLSKEMGFSVDADGNLVLPK